MSNEDLQAPQNPKHDPSQEKAANWSESNEGKALSQQFRDFRTMFVERGGDFANFYSERYIPSLREFASQRGLSAEDLKKYGAYHVLVGSTVNVNDYPDFDTPNNDIQESFEDVYAQEIGRLAQKDL